MVKKVSKARIKGLFSTAIKYPRLRISMKTKSSRNMAPPRQLKPNVWINSKMQ